PAAWPRLPGATSRSPRPRCAPAARRAAAPIFRNCPRSDTRRRFRWRRACPRPSNGTGPTTTSPRNFDLRTGDDCLFPTKIARAAGTGASVAVECCQVCGHAPLTNVLSLGYMPPVNQMVPIGEVARQQHWFPTDLFHCANCDLVQLGLAVDPAII